MIGRDKPKMSSQEKDASLFETSEEGRLTNHKQNGSPKVERYSVLVVMLSLSLCFQVISAFNYPTSGSVHEWKPSMVVDSSLDSLLTKDHELNTKPDDDHSVQETGYKESDEQREKLNAKGHLNHENEDTQSDSSGEPTSRPMTERERFAIEILKLLHRQYGGGKAPALNTGNIIGSSNSEEADNGDEEVQKKFDNNNRLPEMSSRQQSQSSMAQLLGALGADGDLKRLIDWAQNSFNLASIGEIATQFVVSKLGGVNCGAVFKPDGEETLVPRFLLFNEHFADVPYELPINPSETECIANGKFDPIRKTVVLIHGYLAGYTLVDGLTNIKNRLLDLNKVVSERTLRAFEMAHESNGSYVLTEDLDVAIRQHKYNVVIVDWFNGANPVPRANYIKAAVNAQVVGQLIARFLSAMVVRCETPAANLQIIAHSLGCHVAGFTGKAMNRAGHRLGKITHLDPVGLCFGRLFSEPKLRLSPDDALDTQAVHVSLNLFDNPLDGAQANFLVNGGRDQIGCGGQSELKNSTSSSVSLLFNSEGEFTPCSHMRALALYEDDLSSNPNQCQLVGYRCPSYEQYLAGKCGHCDTLNNQCRLMSLPPISVAFSKMNISPETINPHQRDVVVEAALSLIQDIYPNGIDKRSSSTSSSSRINEIKKRNDNDSEAGSFPTVTTTPTKSALSQRQRLALAVDKIKMEARNALAEGWTSLATGDVGHRTHLSQLSEKFKNRKSISSSKNNDNPSQYSDEIPSMPTSVQPPPPTREETRVMRLQTEATMTATTSTLAPSVEQPASRFQADRPDIDLVPMPLGGQKPPPGSLLGPLYYLGTGPITPFCVNYYQLRILISEPRLQRMIVSNRLAPNKLASNRPATSAALGNPFNRQQNSFINKQAQRISASTGRSILHMTVKLVDSSGHFFKGFTLKENARQLQRVHDGVHIGQQARGRDNLVEITMLLNTTETPRRISESIISYYFHGIVLADKMELNYMSNISPG